MGAPVVSDMLVTLEELASYLQEDVDTATATLAIEIATGLVQAATCQRLIYVADDPFVLYVDEYDTSPWLELPELPVTAFSSIQVGATAVSDVTADLSRGRLYRRTGWRSVAVYPWNQPSTVSGVYSHGYQVGDRKLQLARSVTLVIAAAAYGNPIAATREQIDDYAIQYTETATARLDAMPSTVAALRRVYGRGPRSALLLRG
jgi:hypothetical protein